MGGFFAVGIEAGKTPENIGGLWRSAHAFGASYIFTVGCRYGRHQRTDTTKAWRSVPLLEFESSIELVSGLPRDARLVALETDDGQHQVPRSLPTFSHPRQAVYLLGAEDHGISRTTLDMCDDVVEIPSAYCLNVATAGSIVLYDRIAKGAR